MEENLDLFRRMRAGEFQNGARVLRAKIDMGSGNINLRDPVLYRILHATHPRTGTQWKIYPSYDYAHGQSDAIEGVTHSICTLEFEDHRPLYDWAEHLIKAGKAYVDDQCQEEMRVTRGTLTEPGKNSPFRNRSVEENLDLFRRMRAGEFPNGARVLLSHEPEPDCGKVIIKGVGQPYPRALHDRKARCIDG